MRSMTDEGFVWLDEPVRQRGLTVRRETSAAHPPEATLSAQATKADDVEPPIPAVVRWQPAPRLRWQERVLRVARTAVDAWTTASTTPRATRGRRAVLHACLELGEALTSELRHALYAP